MDDYPRGGARGGGYRSDRSPKRFRQEDDYHLCGLATSLATLLLPADTAQICARG